MTRAHLEDQTDHLSKTNTASSRLSTIGQEMNNPSSLMYSNSQFRGLVIVHTLGI